MISSELDFSKWLVDNLKGHVVRIENSIASGMPDVNACIKGQEYWMELKFNPKGERPLLRKYQYAWGIKRSCKGGRVFVFSYVNESLVRMWKFSPTFRVSPKNGDYVEVISEPLECSLRDLAVFGT